jgi:hypothetical protein
MAVMGVIWTLLPDPLTTTINRPPGDPSGRNLVHLLPCSLCYYPIHCVVDTFIAIVLRHTPIHLRIFPLCSGSSSPRLFDPNIWCPSCSKPKGNPDDAIKTTQSTSPSKRRLHPNLRSKSNSSPIHSGPPHHR